MQEKLLNIVLNLSSATLIYGLHKKQEHMKTLLLMELIEHQQESALYSYQCLYLGCGLEELGQLNEEKTIMLMRRPT